MQRTELAPAIWSYPLVPDRAEAIVATLRGLPEDAWDPSLVLDHDEPQESRTSASLRWDDSLRTLRLTLRAMFDACLRDYNRSFRTGADMVERVGVLRYLPGETYRPHVDSSWKSYRVVSGLIYLDPASYTGGETWFPRFEVAVKPERPAVVLFPSNYAYLHEARQVDEGVKYVAVTWVNDLPKGEDLRS